MAHNQQCLVHSAVLLNRRHCLSAAVDASRYSRVHSEACYHRLGAQFLTYLRCEEPKLYSSLVISSHALSICPPRLLPWRAPVWGQCIRNAN
jgi:hypothetical protein